MFLGLGLVGQILLSANRVWALHEDPPQSWRLRRRSTAGDVRKSRAGTLAGIAVPTCCNCCNWHQVERMLQEERTEEAWNTGRGVLRLASRLPVKYEGSRERLLDTIPSFEVCIRLNHQNNVPPHSEDRQLKMGRAQGRDQEALSCRGQIAQKHYGGFAQKMQFRSQVSVARW